MGIFRNTNRKPVEYTEKDKIRVIASREELRSLKNVMGTVHLCFRPSNVDIFELVRSCPGMRIIQVPTAYIGSISVSAKTVLNMRGISLKEGTIHRVN